MTRTQANGINRNKQVETCFNALKQFDQRGYFHFTNNEEVLFAIIATLKITCPLIDNIESTFAYYIAKIRETIAYNKYIDTLREG